jgi:hypothetical protein
MVAKFKSKIKIYDILKSYGYYIAGDGKWTRVASDGGIYYFGNRQMWDDCADQKREFVEIESSQKNQEDNLANPFPEQKWYEYDYFGGLRCCPECFIESLKGKLDMIL